MSTDGGGLPSLSKMNLFDYTQKSFWGGPSYPYYQLILATIFGGFFGLDHLLLRSPSTAFLKFVFNIFSLGLWYFYDILQVLGDKQQVMEKGLTAPIVGPLGIGAGMFFDNQPDAEHGKSPWRFIAYMMLLFVPFGFEFFAAGDVNGAFMKFLTSVLFFLWPIAIIWTIYNFGYSVFATKSLLTGGTSRMFPFSFFMSKQGPSKLGPIDLPVPKTELEKMCEPGGTQGIGRTLVDAATFPLRTAATAVGTAAGAAAAVAFPSVVPAVEASALAIKTGADVASAALEGSKDVIDAAVTGAVPAAKMGHNTTVMGIDAIKATPQFAAAVQGKLDSLANPAAIAAAAAAAKKMSGGGRDGFDLSDQALLFLFVAILGGGSLLAFFRLRDSSWFDRTSHDTRGNDAPPKPRGYGSASPSP